VCNHVVCVFLEATGNVYCVCLFVLDLWFSMWLGQCLFFYGDDEHHLIH
jgi:hypothetical protein